MLMPWSTQIGNRLLSHGTAKAFKTGRCCDTNKKAMNAGRFRKISVFSWCVKQENWNLSMTERIIPSKLGTE